MTLQQHINELQQYSLLAQFSKTCCLKTVFPTLQKSLLAERIRSTLRLRSGDYKD